MTEENRRQNVQLAFESARRELEDACTLLDAARYTGSVGHAYYGAYHAARALLLSLGEQPRTHTGLNSRLNLHFVRTGRLLPELGSSLAILFSQRQLSTYDPAAVFTRSMAEEVVQDARRFVEAAAALLRGDGWLA